MLSVAISPVVFKPTAEKWRPLRMEESSTTLLYCFPQISLFLPYQWDCVEGVVRRCGRWESRRGRGIDTSSGHGAVSRARRLACPWPAAAYHSARCDTAVLVARPTSSPSSSRAPPSRTRPAPARQPLDYNYYNCTVVPPASRLLFRPFFRLLLLSSLSIVARPNQHWMFSRSCHCLSN